jgi:uncharacterized protein
MSPTPSRPLCGLLGIVYIVLGGLRRRHRRRARVGLGTGSDTALERAVRVHGNFAEYVPLFLVLLLTRRTEWRRTVRAAACRGRGILSGAGRPCLGLSGRTSGTSPGRFGGTLRPGPRDPVAGTGEHLAWRWPDGGDGFSRPTPGIAGEDRRLVCEGLELQRVAGRVRDEHRRLLAGPARKRTRGLIRKAAPACSRRCASASQSSRSRIRPKCGPAPGRRRPAWSRHRRRVFRRGAR